MANPTSGLDNVDSLMVFFVKQSGASAFVGQLEPNRGLAGMGEMETCMVEWVFAQ